MRPYLLTLGLALIAAPAVAAPQPEEIRIPPELTDPQLIERLTNMTDTLSRALLELPVGEIEAAAEGRPVTDADRRRTVRDTTTGEQLQADQQLVLD